MINNKPKGIKIDPIRLIQNASKSKASINKKPKDKK